MANSRAYKVYQNFLRRLSDGEKKQIVKNLNEIKAETVGSGDLRYTKSFEQYAARLSRNMEITVPVQHLSMFYFSSKLGVQPRASDFSDFPEMKEEPKSNASEPQSEECHFCTIL